jgi:hypothetical protein
MNKKYLLTGKEENGVFTSDYSGTGFIYKSEEKYLNYPDEICYIPEYGFPEDEVCCVNEGDVDGYTKNRLMELCNGNEKFCDFLFYELDWQCPETFLIEFEEVFFNQIKN